ncbi:MAG: bifunctional chorismate mutase/prephenate dehydrogenase [Desulfatirhabdiaceae bacterium]|nr:bifunctional chorismate mutase/prephenate dehydrogenase [Desulfatirhabdiaceae bacterium]
MKNNDIQNDDIDPALSGLRQDIDAIDAQIVSLLADRQHVVRNVASLKKSHNLPVYHPAREEDLISRRRQQAKDTGLDPDFIEEIYRTIIRRSRVVQTRSMALKSLRPEGLVLLVGGKGGMGRYFEACFGRAGYRVRILDKENWPDARSLCDGIDLAMVGVPIDVSCQVIRNIGPFIPAKAVLCDITSIKEQPLEAMLKAHAGPVIGLHPLFGPTTSSLDKQIVVATPGRDDDACQWVLDQFATWGAVVVRSDAAEHDDIMGIVQSLRHFATFAFGQFMKRRQISLARTLEFSSPIYRLELGMVGRLFAQDPSLYSEIIFASEQRRELLKDYLTSLCENLEMLEKGDKQLFQKEFQKIAEWFGPFSEQAMRESTFLIDKLIERF